MSVVFFFGGLRFLRALRSAILLFNYVYYWNSHKICTTLGDSLSTFSAASSATWTEENMTLKSVLGMVMRIRNINTQPIKELSLKPNLNSHPQGVRVYTVSNLDNKSAP